jgi:hypothetical protein
MKTSDTSQRGSGLRFPAGLALIVFLGISIFFLWAEHKAHIMGALPYALLLLCVVIHFFMHAGHGKGHSDNGGMEH